MDPILVIFVILLILGIRFSQKNKDKYFKINGKKFTLFYLSPDSSWDIKDAEKQVEKFDVCSLDEKEVGELKRLLQSAKIVIANHTKIIVGFSGPEERRGISFSYHRGCEEQTINIYGFFTEKEIAFLVPAMNE